MRPYRGIYAVLLLFFAGSAFTVSSAARQTGRTWPAIAAETKPWTRWWWQGSAVDRASLTAQLEALAAAGLGGVEVTPIYGVRGTEDRFIPYLSPPWMAMLDHTLREATRLKLGVDMATGTGWPFGGPWIDDDSAPRSIAYKTWTLGSGERLAEPVTLQQAPLVRAIGNQIHVVNEGAPGDPPRGGASAAPVINPGARALQITDLVEPVAANRNLQALALEQVKYPRNLPLVVLMAYSDTGNGIDLTSRVLKDGSLDWTAPQGRWTLYALFAAWHGKLVERAAPGGEGNVIDHFSTDAIKKYLLPFDRAFTGHSLSGLRAFFNDSYEVDDATGEADWTPSFFAEFEKRRGYDLRRHLPALLEPQMPQMPQITQITQIRQNAGDVGARVLADYRETISDLLLDTFTTEWSSWAKRRGRQVRNQAHGSPANLLDLYAASDIPETEGADIQRFKWASSAAHIAGRRLVGAEAATWLGEHFRVRLADVRAAVDRFFVAGVNHVVYHGTAYSPVQDPWPGWQFYASVEFNPQNAWWDDFGALNGYVARVQSFMQSGRPDNDVLLYYPFYESLTARGKSRLAHFGGAAPPAQGTTFEKAAETLQARGFTYDFISDRQVRRLKVASGLLTTEGGGSYRTLVLPGSRYAALETVLQTIELARSGATVVSFDGWPSDVGGLADLDGRRTRLTSAINAVTFGPADTDGIREATIGRGRILQGRDLSRLLARAKVQRESMVDHGFQFARRVDAMGRVYFVSNPGDRAVDGWIPLDSRAETVMAFDPMSGRHGQLPARTSGTTREIYLQLPPGGSLIVAESPARGRETFHAFRPAGEPVAIAGPWTVRFLKGGPRLPSQRTVDRLGSWTTFGSDGEAFSGTAAYTTTIARPKASAQMWQLDLGRVAESARVRLNGRDLATLIGPPYRVVLGASQLRATNTLEVAVTNLSANRIRELDLRGVDWKKFYNVNFPARLPENRGPDGLFTAGRWEPLESGLLGPVTLTPITVLQARSEQVAVADARESRERIVSIDGRQMRVKTGGFDHLRNGVPVVVFETGLQSPLESWLGVPTEASGFAPVVSYDRAGIGRSEADVEPPMPARATRNLRALLAEIGVKPPYVLVGHSYGGLLLRSFAGLYPGEVAGLVFVDPTDARSDAESLEFYKARGYTEPDVPKLRARLQQRFQTATGTEMAAAMELERTHFAEIRALPSPPDVPVAVLMAVKYDPAPWQDDPCNPRDCYEAWVRLRVSWLMPLVRASSGGTLTVTTSSGHNMQRDDPELVVAAIRRVVRAATKRR